MVTFYTADTKKNSILVSNLLVIKQLTLLARFLFCSAETDLCFD